MKHTILIAIFIFSLSLFTKANQDCIWSSSKAGITIRYVAPCKFVNQSVLDSFLNKIITLLNRKDTTLKVWVLINEEQLSFPGKHLNYFTSIGFDTLRLMENDSIFNYYQNKTEISMNENYGVNKFESNLEPIDINFQNRKVTGELGVKIIFNKYYKLDESDWDDILNLIVYASESVDKIKAIQKIDTVRYNANGWYITLITLDTFTINKILGKHPQVAQKEQIYFSPKIFYLILIIIGIIVTVFLFILRKHYS